MAFRNRPQLSIRQRKKKRPYTPKPASPLAINKYLTIGEVAQRFRLTKRAIQWRVRKGKFPKPYRFSHNQTLWLIEDIEAYERQAAPQALVPA